MFGYFTGGRFRAAFRGADREFQRAFNRIPGVVKLVLLLGAVMVIIKSNRAETVVRNTLRIIGAAIIIDWATRGLAGGLAGFFVHRDNRIQDQEVHQMALHRMSIYLWDTYGTLSRKK